MKKFRTSQKDLLASIQSSAPWRDILPGRFAALFLALLWCVGLVPAALAQVPTITQQPQPRCVVVGTNVTFQMVATGASPLQYQWRFGSTDLTNQTNASLALINIQTNQAGGYQVRVSNGSGSITSAVAFLTVRQTNDPIYLPPQGGWAYLYDGNSVSNLGTAALDGTWNHDNGSDAWAGDGRGPDDGIPGGISTTNGVVTFEDALAAGAGNDNRRLYLTHALGQEPVPNASTILNDGVTLSFRARLTPPPPFDPLTELTNAPNGFVNVADGKGMIGLRQSGSSGMLVSFSLNQASEDTAATTSFDFPAAGLHMNNLNGNVRTAAVDPGEGGTANVLALDPTTFHEFWITIQDNGSAPGTHVVTIYLDGAKVGTNFNVTAGIGFDISTNYLAIGLPSTTQRGAFDLDFLAYKPGVFAPTRVDEPAEILVQPVNKTVAEGAAASFNVGVTGTPPVSFQWFKNGVAILGATNGSYTTPPVTPSDSGAAFAAVVSNLCSIVTSSNAILTVIPDLTPPSLISAGSLNGQSIGLCFSEAITSASAQNIANYSVNGGAVTVTNAILRTNDGGTSVLLQISGLGSQANTAFVVSASNIRDVSAAANVGGGTVNGIVHGMTAEDIGTTGIDPVKAGSTFTCSSNRFEATASGSGLGGTNDAVQFIYMNRNGDFDLRTRVSRLDARSSSARAGIVAREGLARGTRAVNVTISPAAGDNAYSATVRATSNDVATVWPGGASKPGVPYPDAWVRLTRIGNSFTAYEGTNGLDWNPFGQTTQVLSSNLVVGLGATPQTNAVDQTAFAVFEQVLFAPPPTILSQPQSLTVTNGDPAQFSVSATGLGTLRYQWRFNATNIANETNSSLMIPNATPANAGTYDVVVANAGGATVSQPATLTVRVFDFGDAPAPYPSLLAQNGARHLIAGGIFLGAAVDFETNAIIAGAANGDDITGVDDEDGVRFTSAVGVGQSVSLEVVASTNGILNAWVDFDADGGWSESGDHIFTDRPLTPGTNLLSFLVPVSAKASNTFARFRFSSSAGLLPTGSAADGEVEDYAVQIIPVSELALTATDSPDPVAVGSNLTYVVTIVNNGPSTATGVTLTNTFVGSADVLSLNSSQGSCTNTGARINCALGNLLSSANASVTMVVRPSARPGLTNIFAIAAAETDPNVANNTATVITTVELAPSITTQPTSLTVTQHNTAQFTVQASGTAPLSYQWLFNGTAITGATNTTLTITDAQSANEGTYRVRVSNRVGAADSVSATLTVLIPITITQQPQSQTNFAGSTATLQVTATGTQPITYQWFFNRTNSLNGASNATLTLTNVQKSQSGIYSVRLSNSASVTNSTEVTLQVIEIDFGDAPSSFPTLFADNGARHRIVPGFYLGAGVDFEPQGQPSTGANGDDANGSDDEDGVTFRTRLLVGQNTTVDVVASSNGVLNAWIDWNGNGSWADSGEQVLINRALNAGTNSLVFMVPTGAIPGSRAARFRFSSASGLSFTGEALDGEVEDYVATVEAAIDLGVQAQVAPNPVGLGSNLVYRLSLTNSGPSPATSINFTSTFPGTVTISNIVASQGSCTNQGTVVICSLGTLASAGTGQVQIVVVPTQAGSISNFVTAFASEPDVQLTNNQVNTVVSALEGARIVTQPRSLTVTNGNTASFQVAATGTSLRYQWTFEGNDINGATNDTFTIPAAQPANAGTYRVRVSNALTQLTSDSAVLTVLVPPAITTQPADRTVVAGNTATFSVVATGTAPLSYQWLFGGVEMGDRTNATLSIANAQSSDAGTYRVKVSNVAGEVLSTTVQLTVLIPPTISEQPRGGTVLAGQGIALRVVATGTDPLTYQWFFNNAAISGATTPTLALSNLRTTNSGDYVVVLSNSAAVVTSDVARVTVRDGDFGDASGPSYATLLVFNGAYHFITPGVFLGQRVDAELDGQPDAAAMGDDQAGVDDEDGVFFPSTVLVGQLARVDVVASTNGFLDAWMDFNANGDWIDPGEQIFASQALHAGTNSLNFMVPSTAQATGIVSRFRFSTAGGLSFGGPANDGEVEDYIVPIQPAIDLKISMSDSPDPVLAETNLRLQVAVSNAGPSTATGITVRDTLPGTVLLTAMSPSQGSCSNQGTIVSCDLGTLAAGAIVTIDLDMLPHRIGVISHRAQVSASEFELNTNDNSAIELSTVVAAFGPFRDVDQIGLPDFGPASTYPSTITVSGVTGTVHQVIVTLQELSHTFPDDLDILLVGPSGQKVVLMSDAGGDSDAVFLTFNIDDTAVLALPDNSRLLAGESYRPSNYEGLNDTFELPAPPGPYASQLSAFRGTDPNGTWSLYIMDDTAEDSGQLGGWSLSFLALDPISDVSVGISAAPDPVAVGQQLVYTVVATNTGPAAIAHLWLTNPVPANVITGAVTSTQGSCTNMGGTIICDLGPVEALQTATATVTVTPQQAGLLTNSVTVGGSELDLKPANNSAKVVSAVRHLADLAVLQTDSQDPAPVNQSFTYQLVVTNRGPQVADNVSITDILAATFQFTSVTTSQGQCTNDGAGRIACDLGNLAAGSSASVQVFGRGTLVTRITNAASVTGLIIDPNPSNNSASEGTAIVFAAPAFVNGAAIAIQSNRVGTPYPSSIQVSGLTGALYKVTVSLSNLTASIPEGLQLLLTGPSGQKALLMSGVGGGNAINNASLELNQSAGNTLPDNTQVASGVYRPTSYNTLVQSLPAPAPGLPYPSDLTVFQGTDPNGAWSLFMDNTGGNGTGSLAGWALNISTLEPIADIALALTAPPSPITVSSNFTYLITASNRGPANATGVMATNEMSPLMQINSVSTTQGSCSPAANFIVCDLGSLSVGAQAQISISGVGLTPGNVTNRFTTAGRESDLNLVNNLVEDRPILQLSPPRIQTQPANQTVTAGSNATFTVSADGAEPLFYQWLHESSEIPGATASSLTVTAVTSADAGNYSVRISNSVATVFSQSARLTVLVPPSISGIGPVTLNEDTASEDIPFTVGDLETPATALTLEADSSNAGLIPAANISFGGAGANRTLKIIPAPNQNGSAAITVTVRDGDGLTASTSFTATVLNVNDPPLISAIANQVMDEDGQQIVAFTIGDIETAPDTLLLSATAANTNLFGAAGLVFGGSGSNRTVRLAPIADQFGSSRITIEVEDADHAKVAQSFDVDVRPVNDPPNLAVIPDVEIDEDSGAHTVALQGIGSGASNEVQTLTVRASLSNSNLLRNLAVSYVTGSTGVLSFETVSNVAGSATISVTVDDGGPSNNITTRVFTVLISELNDLPELSAIPDQLVAEDGSVTLPFLAIDTETATDALIYTARSSNTNLISTGGFTFGGTGTNRSLTLTPAANQSGAATITVTIIDARDARASRSFELRVSAVNDPPTLDVIPDLDLAEDVGRQTVQLNHITAGAPNEQAVLLLAATSSNPSLIPNPVIDYHNPNTQGSLSFTPQPNASGTAVITVTVDDRGASNNVFSRTFRVNVSAVNDLPTISQIQNQATSEDTALTISFAVDDLETPAAALAVAATSANQALVPNSNLTVSGNGTNRTLRIAPGSGKSGTADITVTVTDTNNGSASVIFVLTVDAVNHAPSISDIQDQQISEDAIAGLISFSISDDKTAADNLSLTVLSTNPTLAPVQNIVFGGAGTNRTIAITPAANRSGLATITVIVRDSDGSSASDSFVLDVRGINDLPVISSISDIVINQNETVALPFSVHDEETASSNLVVTATSSNTNLVPNASLTLGGVDGVRTMSFAPAANQAGSARITITVRDEDGGIATTGFQVQVNAVLNPPTITLQPQSQTVTNGDTLVLNVAASGQAPLSYRWFFNSAPISGATNTTYTFANVQAANGGNYFAIVTNAVGGATSAVVMITVVPAPNRAPPAISDVVNQTTSEDTPITVPFVVQDPDTAPHFLTVSATSSDVTVLPVTNIVVQGAGTNRTVTLVPAPNASGSSLVTLTVSDGLNTASDSFQLTVSSVNDAPTLDPIPNRSVIQRSGGAVSYDVPLTGISVGVANESGTVTFTAASSNTGIIPTPTIAYTAGASTGTLTLRPANGASGTVTITVNASDGVITTTRTFTVYVRVASNGNPTISTIADRAINEDSSTGPIAFTIGDDATAAASLGVTAFASNTNLIPASGIVFGGSGANRTITLTPATNRFGTSVVFITVTDANLGAVTTNFTLTVNSVNDLPTISSFSSQVIDEDTSSAPIAFTVGDLESFASALTVSGSSSNPGLIPNTNLQFGGSGSNRVLVLTPLPNQFGSATITVSVSDADGGSRSTNFTLTVNSQNDSPRISDIPDVTIQQNTSTAALPFVISDIETSAGSLGLIANSSDTVLVPIGNITFGGSGGSRTVTVQPAPNRSGSAVITVTVSDGAGGAAADAFLVQVTAPASNAPPTLDTISDIVINEGSTVQTVNLSGISAGAGSLNEPITVSATSGDRNVIPDPVVTYTSLSSTGTLRLDSIPGTHGRVVITVNVSDGRNFVSRSFAVTIRALPTISRIADVTVSEDTSSGVLNFQVSDVETAATNLVVTKSSSNPTLIPTANIVLDAGETNRTVVITPAADQFGSALITLTVTDGDGLSQSNTFAVIVLPINDPPTLDAISDRSIFEDQGVQTVLLTGISSGAANENQPLMVTTTSSNPNVLPAPVVTYVSPNPTGSLTFTPIPNANGSAIITVMVTDGQSTNQVVTRTFTVVVNPVDDPPTIDPIQDVVTDEDSPAVIVQLTGISSGDLNEGQPVTVTAVCSDPSIVAAQVSYTNFNSVGILSLTPQPNAFGSVLVTVTVNDGQNTVSQVFAAIVNSVPDTLTMSSIPDQTIDEDRPLGPVAFAINDESIGANVTLTASSSNAALISPDDVLFGGSGTNRTVFAQPKTNQFGATTITVVVRNNTGTVVSNSFQVIVRSVDDFPQFAVGIPDQSILEDTSITIPFVIGDAETPADVLVVGRTSYSPGLVPDGAIIFGGSGSNRTVRITPTPNQNGVAKIEIRIRDEAVQRSTNIFFLTVRPVEDLPTITEIGNQTIPEDGQVDIGFLVDDLDGPASMLTVSGHSSNQNLVADSAFVFGGTDAIRTLHFGPLPDAFGQSTITVSVRDPAGNVASRSFELTVVPVNDLPVISSVADAQINVNESLGPIAVVVGDKETAAADLVLSARSSNTNLVSGVQFGGTGSNRTVSITPVANQFGLAVVSIDVSDLDGGKATSSFELVVNQTNGAPLIALEPQSQTVTSGTQVSLRAVATGPGPLSYQWTRDGLDIPDANNAALTFNPVQRSDDGSYQLRVTNPNGRANTVVARLRVFENTRILSINRTGNVARISFNTVTGQRYTAEYRNVFGSGGWQELETLTGTGAILTVIDSAATGPTRFYRVRVDMLNQAPTLDAIPVQTTLEDQPIVVPFTVGDDSPVDSLVFSVVSTNQVLLPSTNMIFGGLGANRTLRIVPGTNQFGTNFVTINVADTNGDAASRTFELHVRSVDDFPQFVVGIPDQSILEDTSITIPFVIGDAETPADVLVVGRTSYSPGLVPDGAIIFGGSGSNRTVRITPNPNQNGVAKIEIRIRDEAVQRSTNIFFLTVLPVEDLPTITEIGNQTIPEDGQVDIGFLVDDLDGPASTLTVSGHSSNQNLVADSAFAFGGTDAIRTLHFGPLPDAFGQSTITVSVRDPAGNVASRTFELTVVSVNDLPTISTIASAQANINDAIGPISFVIGDKETAAADLVLSARSSNTNLVALSGVQFGGTESNRTVSITPVANQFGLAVVSIDVSDLDGGKATSSFEVVVNQTNGPPVIALDPQGQTVVSGTEVSLRVVATGPGPLTYQWMREGLDIPGANNAALTFNPVQRSDDGTYAVRVSNGGGSVSSAAARLRVYEAARILTLVKNGSTVQISFGTVIGQRYTVEYRDSFGGGVWSVLESREGTGATLASTDPAASGPSRFYRIRVE